MRTPAFAIAIAPTAVAIVLLVASCASAPPVEDRTWYWLGSLQSLSAMSSPNPEAYTLQIRDGRAAIRAHCNRGTGTAKLEGSHVTFGPMAVTRAFCPPPSRGDQYARQLLAAEQLSVHGPVMRISLKDGGAMFFAEDSKARLSHYRCQDQRMISVVYSGDLAQVWFAGAHYALRHAPAASGALYSDGEMAFHTKGVFGTLRKGDAVLARDCQIPSH